jgi:hypothetical protein
MNKIIAAVAAAFMLSSAAFVAPVAAQGITINVDRDRGHQTERRVIRREPQRRVIRQENRRVDRRDRCTTRTVVTRSNRGERIVRKVRSCR